MTKINLQIVYTVQKHISVDELKALLNTGKSRNQIARDLKISSGQLTNMLKKTGLYTPKVISKNAKEIELEKKELQELANRKLSVAQIAEELGINYGQARHRLERYGIKNPELEELKTLRNYFSATTLNDKNEAFVAVDKYLEQIAKENYKKSYAIPYQDFLQDIRLNFAELADKRENNINNNRRNLFEKIREMDFDKKYMVLKKLPEDLYKTSETDVLIKEFEDSNFLDFRIKNSNLIERDQLIINTFTKLNKNLDEIAEIFSLTPERIRQIILIATEKMNNSKNIY
ncbi:helix-turn-helix transcriptional regulator [bacterium]|nr:helix-turn-helix transcriptional regulator [bacterium]